MRAMLFGIRQAETREAVNNLGQILRLALASHVGEVRLDDIRPLAEAQEVRAKLAATRFPTGDGAHHQGRTSRRTARLEIALSDHLALGLNDAAAIASAARIQEVLSTAGLNPAQEAALRHIGLGKDRIMGVEGVAGAGKSTLIRALRQASGEGISLVAFAPTSSAAANLGASAGIPSRTVASLIQSGGWGLDASTVLVIDEAGQLGNRQALRVLEISRRTGARLILLGDDRQTGAIEQGKPFWLMQKLGLPMAHLTESVRQETQTMKAAVAQARLGNYAASIANLDKVVTGDDPASLAKALVGEWTRLKPESRANTNVLVLENAARLIVNMQIRAALQREGVVAAEETRLSILAAAGMTDQEKRFARFYSRGQILRFARDKLDLGISREVEYRVLGMARDDRGRQRVRLIDEQGRTLEWDPRLGRASQVNVFRSEARDLARGDRIQWRLVDHALGLKNAERGTVEDLRGTLATIRWDMDGRRQQIDLARHKTWDHGYAETVYSAQSKTYDRVYVLAPVRSPLVNGQNYYTAITRARFGVKLWTEDPKRLAERLERHSGEKSSALEGLGRLDRDSIKARSLRHSVRLDRLRAEQLAARAERMAGIGRHDTHPAGPFARLARYIAANATETAQSFDRYFAHLLARGGENGRDGPIPDSSSVGSENRRDTQKGPER
jgi:ATP-dependent exoDNAse (exonuclease V) alpha subunit